MGTRITSNSGGSHIYQPAARFEYPFKRVRIDRQLLQNHSNRQLSARLQEDDRLLDQLAELAAGRGLPYLNIINVEPRLQFVQQTCQAMIIPIEVLDYALVHGLPFGRTLGIPDFVDRNHDEFGVRGNGLVLAFRGAFISSDARFNTRSGQPIILRENSELLGKITVDPGTVVGPGERVEGASLFLTRPLR